MMLCSMPGRNTPVQTNSRSCCIVQQNPCGPIVICGRYYHRSLQHVLKSCSRDSLLQPHALATAAPCCGANVGHPYFAMLPPAPESAEPFDPSTSIYCLASRLALLQGSNGCNLSVVACTVIARIGTTAGASISTVHRHKGSSRSLGTGAA